MKIEKGKTSNMFLAVACCHIYINGYLVILEVGNPSHRSTEADNHARQRLLGGHRSPCKKTRTNRLSDLEPEMVRLLSWEFNVDFEDEIVGWHGVQSQHFHIRLLGRTVYNILKICLQHGAGK